MGGARESFGDSGVIVLADDGRLAAQGTGHRRLARLEGIDHIHLKEGQPQHSVRQPRERQREHTHNRAERETPGEVKEGRKILYESDFIEKNRQTQRGEDQEFDYC